ncbi:MAG: hypothetical protein OXF05_01530 [Hyphomicrobiales bacterium]|nr:hypothetical protein [Hyphomicrobiales bacterium]
MKTVLVLAVLMLGVLASAPAAFALSGPFVPLSSELDDDGDRDPDQSENGRDVAGSDNESPVSAATHTDTTDADDDN